MRGGIEEHKGKFLNRISWSVSRKRKCKTMEALRADFYM